MNIYALILLFSVGLGLIWSYQRWRSLGIPVKHFENLILLETPAVVFGARLYHVFTDFSLYLNDGYRVWAIWQGGLGLYGGLFCGIIVLAGYAYWQKLSTVTILDVISMPLLLVIGVGRWANVANQELLPYAYFESGFVFGLLGIMLVLQRKLPQKPGHYFLLSLGGYALIRFFLEEIRLEPEIFFTQSGFKINQWMSLVVVVFSIIMYVLFNKKTNKEG